MERYIDPHDERVRPKRCRNCGGHVTADFARVFGDNQNRVDSCPVCATLTDIVDGGAVE
jgi:hypothetical protein